MPIPSKQLGPHPASANIVCFDSTNDVVPGDGAAPPLVITDKMENWDLTKANAHVVTAGTTGSTDIQIRRVRSGSPVDMLSTKISIASSATIGTAGVIDTANDDVQENDRIFVDVDTTSGTSPKGLVVFLTFTKP